MPAHSSKNGALIKSEMFNIEALPDMLGRNDVTGLTEVKMMAGRGI